jgi:hypothetical protein
MRVFLTVLAATMVLSAPVAFGQTDPATTTPAPVTTAPTEPNSTTPATPDASQTGETQATDADHHVTCHTVQTVESRLRRSRQRICGTRQQWDTMQDQNNRDVHEMGRVQGQQG